MCVCVKCQKQKDTLKMLCFKSLTYEADLRTVVLLKLKTMDVPHGPVVAHEPPVHNPSSQPSLHLVQHWLGEGSGGVWWLIKIGIMDLKVVWGWGGGQGGGVYSIRWPCGLVQSFPCWKIACIDYLSQPEGVNYFPISFRVTACACHSRRRRSGWISIPPWPARLFSPQPLIFQFWQRTARA